jgi:hypothetical protein
MNLYLVILLEVFFLKSVLFLENNFVICFENCADGRGHI